MSNNNSESIETNSAPVMTEWRKFLFRSEKAVAGVISAGIDMRGNI